MLSKSEFIAACYGYEEAATISDVRFKMWKMKTAKTNIVSAPKLKSLPQANESFQPNVLRAHLQCCFWKHADEGNPPDIEPTMYGWKIDAINKTLTPTLLPSNTPAAPDSMLQLIKVNDRVCFAPVFITYNKLDGYPASLGLPIMHQIHVIYTQGVIAIT